MVAERSVNQRRFMAT